MVDILYHVEPTNCTICGGSEDEDLVLVCDGVDCTNEVHLYCLSPPLYKIPENEWFCPQCNVNGEVERMKTYLQSFLDISSNPYIDDAAQGNYFKRLEILQQNRLPFSSFKSYSTQNQINSIISEFASNDENLIGSLIAIKDYSTWAIYTGRILHRKKDIKYVNRWEHLIQFKSGTEGRNNSCMIWLCLDEIPCTVAVSVVWARIQGYPWWPALKTVRSAMDIVESKLQTNENQKETINSNEIQNQNQIVNENQTEIEKKVNLFFFGDETNAIMDQVEALNSIVLFNERSRDLKPNMNKVIQFF